MYGSSELVQILIQHKADLALTDAEGQTALHAATLYGNVLWHVFVCAV